MKIINTKSTHTSYALVEKPGTPLVMVHITADLAPAIDAKSDVARSLLCDLLLSGAGDMNRNEFLDAVNGAGGSIGVRVHEGRLTVTIETIEARLPKILSLTEMMLTNPTFKSEELARSKETYKKQLKVASEQARAMAQTNLVRSLYKKTNRTYQSTPAEELAAINEVTKDQIRQLHQTFLNSPWTITIGSNANVIKRVQKSISKIHTDSTAMISNSKSVDIPATAKFVTHQITSQQNIEVSIGQRLPLTLEDADYPAVVFALAVLGRWGGFSGRLMSTVREKEGLTYGIYARAEAGERESYGHWRIMTFFHPKDLEKGIASVMQEINKLYRSGITAEELTRFKTILNTNHTLLFDSLASLTNTVHSYNSKNLTFEEYESIMAGMQKLTTKDINTAIKKYIDPAKLSFSLAGNFTALSSQLRTLRTSLKL